LSQKDPSLTRFSKPPSSQRLDDALRSFDAKYKEAIKTFTTTSDSLGEELYVIYFFVLSMTTFATNLRDVVDAVQKLRFETSLEIPYARIAEKMRLGMKGWDFAGAHAIFLDFFSNAFSSEFAELQKRGVTTRNSRMSGSGGKWPSRFSISSSRAALRSG
jgi:hypothetical protein